MAPKALIEFFKNWGPDLPLSSDIKNKLKKKGGWDENQTEKAYLESFALRRVEEKQAEGNNLFVKKSSDWSHLTSSANNSGGQVKSLDSSVLNKTKGEKSKKMKKIFLIFLKIIWFFLALFLKIIWYFLIWFFLICYFYKPTIFLLQESGYLNFLIQKAPFLFSEKLIKEIQVENDKDSWEDFFEANKESNNNEKEIQDKKDLENIENTRENLFDLN